MQSFYWNGADSYRAYGVRMAEPPKITRAPYRVQHFTVPGRSGTVDVLERERDSVIAWARDPYFLTINAFTPANHLGVVREWLRPEAPAFNKYGELKIQPEMDKIIRAELFDAIDFTKMPHNLDWYSFQAVFYCMPYRLGPVRVEYLIYPHDSIFCAGEMDNYPQLKVSTAYMTETADIEIAFTVGANQPNYLTIYGVPPDVEVIVDCEWQDCYYDLFDPVAEDVIRINPITSGPFPHLENEENFFLGTEGVYIASAKIQERWL